MLNDAEATTTDRAFEVWVSVIEAETGRPYWKVVNEHTAFVAGVREGIRQAREAVVDGYWQHDMNLNAAIERIDALET